MNVRRSIIFSQTKNATVFNNDDDEDEDVEESLVVVALLLLMFSILNLINAGILSDEHSDMTSNNQRIPFVMFGNEFATTSISILLLVPSIFFPKSFDSNTSKHKSITLLGSNSKVPTSCHRYVNFLSSLSLSLSSLLSLPEQ